ncbi:hypothetical protein AGMMS49546_21890 [Spirochaetia bacterium]|nr:hypothetical protein AGMMS49546_21890 [Spirochaetia bacterium]
MGQNLRARLQRIREAGKQIAATSPQETAPEDSPVPDVSQPRVAPEARGEGIAAQNPPSLTADSPLFHSSFVESGFQTLKRTVLLDIPLALPPALPAALPILIPDLRRYRRERDAGQAEQAGYAKHTGYAEHTVNPRDLLFFDLETTGLSGGAGTVAFLAAFGRFVPPSGEAMSSVGKIPWKLHITQYLLLDYPGEGDFLEAALGEFSPDPGCRPQGADLSASQGFPLIVSYNGKSFDSQILKTRCLMNGMKPPVYAHADLLHPARRLWKRVLSDCSQATIETEILGLDRTGDVSGAMAPEIWFDFLKNNDAAPLLGICDHNLKDIQGLAVIFSSLSQIAADPLAAMDTFRVDCEQLALRWRDALRREPCFGEDEARGELMAAQGRLMAAAQGEERRLGERLLERAAERGGPRAAYVLALDLIRRGRAGEGREKLQALAAGDPPGEVKGLAWRQLAIDAEWRLRDAGAALSYVEKALALENNRESLQKELAARRERLLLKGNEKRGVWHEG